MRGNTESCQARIPEGSSGPVMDVGVGQALTFQPGDTRGEALRRTRSALAAAGIAEAALDARCLVALATGADAAGLALRPETPLGPEGAALLGMVLQRRLAREPVGRIMGEREFWGLPFRLSPGTLEPRPDTEAVVEAALAAVPDRAAPRRILDLGTGSGCLLVALLSEWPQAFGIGTDRSLDAVRTARFNADRNGVGPRAAFMVGDWAAALGAPFDVVVSNPPYIPAPDIAGLAPEVSRHDPRAALDGGPDGLAAYRTIVADLPRLLRPGGIAVFEIGHDQAAGVGDLVAGCGLRLLRVRRDLAGRDRALVVSHGA